MADAAVVLATGTLAGIVPPVVTAGGGVPAAAAAGVGVGSAIPGVVYALTY